MTRRRRRRRLNHLLQRLPTHPLRAPPPITHSKKRSWLVRTSSCVSNFRLQTPPPPPPLSVTLLLLLLYRSLHSPPLRFRPPSNSPPNTFTRHLFRLRLRFVSLAFLAASSVTLPPTPTLPLCSLPPIPVRCRTSPSPLPTTPCHKVRSHQQHLHHMYMHLSFLLPSIRSASSSRTLTPTTNPSRSLLVSSSVFF